ncbi:centromere protein T isoform X2 [Octodon degus]|uniref:Centromere protein T n=1 Tax=Octodon degus TaxID=10160 RepID=A0A6P6DZ46_OCTDE|nr:centromere protein T isoform X2 [Octodon degus]
MANNFSPDSEPTARTLLRRVLDTADSCTPQRRRSDRISAQRTLLETPSSRRRSIQTKVTARQRSHGARSTGRLAHGQAGGQLEEQTPRTLLKNILLTAPESSIVMPQSVVKPAPAPQVVQPSRRKSSQSSLELQLPELEPPPTLAPVLLGSGRRKQKLRLSVFQKEVEWGPQGLPVSQEPPGNPDASSLTSSLNLTFATPLQPHSVRKPGLARRPPTRRAIDVGALLQDLQNNSLASTPLDIVLEDTQPFSQPLVGHSPNVHYSLPHPYPGPEDAEGTVHHRTQGSIPELQNHKLQPEPADPLEMTEAEGSKRAMEAKNPEESSGDEDISDRPGKRPSVRRSQRTVEPKIPEESSGDEDISDRPGKRSSVKRSQRTRRPEEPKRSSKDEDISDRLGKRPSVERSRRAVEPEEPERSSEDEDISDRPASSELASNVPEFLQAKQLDQFLEPAPSSGATVLSSEPQEPVLARTHPRPRTAVPRPRQDPHKGGLNHYTKLFSFYAKMPMERKALEMVEKCLDKYLQHLCNDLEVFAAHAGRKTVKPEDLELLMRRQGLVTDQVSLHVLVERHLPLEYRQLIIPCAFSGNSVFPAQ